MKKFIYIAMFSLVIAATFTACTEENVKPQTETNTNPGGGAMDPKGPY